MTPREQATPDRAGQLTGGEPAAGPAGRPPELLEVVAGHPSAAEIAALTVVLSAALARRDRAAGPGRAGRPAAGWASRARPLRAPLRPGPDAWRRSGLPG
jgi:Acyl-CoA carboxylase epsilon subunit